MSSPMSRSVPFFSVSVRKLVVLSIFTLGFYDIYWSYKHWRCTKEYAQQQALSQTNGQVIHPRFFAVFSLITIIGLTKRVNREARQLAKQTFLSPLWAFLIHTILLHLLAFSAISLAFTYKEFYENMPLSITYYDNIVFLLSGLTLRIAPLALLQVTANQVNLETNNETPKNRSFSAANTMIAIVGCIVMIYIFLL